jgi:hypothetical protein
VPHSTSAWVGQVDQVIGGGGATAGRAAAVVGGADVAGEPVVAVEPQAAASVRAANPVATATRPGIVRRATGMAGDGSSGTRKGLPVTAAPTGSVPGNQGNSRARDHSASAGPGARLGWYPHRPYHAGPCR